MLLCGLVIVTAVDELKTCLNKKKNHIRKNQNKLKDSVELRGLLIFVNFDDNQLFTLHIYASDHIISLHKLRK